MEVIPILFHPIYMKEMRLIHVYRLALLLLLFIWSHTQVRGQVTVNPTLVDSSEISLPIGCTSFLTGSQSKAFTQFRGTGFEVETPEGAHAIEFEVEKMDHNRFRGPVIRYAAAWGEGYLVSEYWERKIYQLNAEGKVIADYKLNNKYFGIPFDQFVWGINNGAFIPESGTLFLPTLSIENNRENINKHLGDAPGSVAMYQLVGNQFKIVKLLAPWRGVYGKEVYQPNDLGYVEVSLSPDHQQVMVNPIADPGIRVYTPTGDLLYEFGQIGQHAFSEIDLIPEFYVKNPQSSYGTTELYLGSTIYDAVQVDANGKYAYRMYRPGYGLDQIPASTPDASPEKIAEVSAATGSLRANRPTYLQVYDLQSKDKPLLTEVLLSLHNALEILRAENGVVSIYAPRADKPTFCRIYEVDLGLR